MNKFTEVFNQPSSPDALTENNALSFSTTGDKALDFFGKSGSLQGDSDSYMQFFKDAYYENPKLATVLAFYSRDVRGGQGQRENFRQALTWLFENDKAIFDKIASLVPEYGRWDDLLHLFDLDVVAGLIFGQLQSDSTSEHPSLLAKWLPSENASSAKSRKLALKISNKFGFSPKYYRKLLSKLRAKIKIVESQMSAGKWNEVEYSRVPSKANLLYRKAFAKHDPIRYNEFIAAAAKGEVKINSGTLYPHDLVHKAKTEYSHAVDALWNQLPDFMDTDENIMALVDVSGSMEDMIKGTSVSRMDVSIGLGIYFAEHNKGAFKNLVISFTSKPEFIELTAQTLKGKIKNILDKGVGYDTNLEAAIVAILERAKFNKVPAFDMPTKLVVITDMQFNEVGDITNYQNLVKLYAESGYELPDVVFWNVGGNTQESPVQKKDQRVALVSGFSPSILAYVLNGKLKSPVELMLEVANSERYAKVTEAIK